MIKVKLFRGGNMHVVRMQFSHGACCATGEMCGFSHFDPVITKQWGNTEKEQLQRIAPYAYEHILKYGYARQGEYHYGKGETVEEAWTNALKATQEHVDTYSYKGFQLRYFWFVKYPSSSTYENDALRQLISTDPRAIALGAFQNANTGNTVDGYLVAFENTIGEDPEQDEDEDDEGEW